MNRTILATIIIIFLTELLQLSCSCDSAISGFVIITQSLSDGEVGKPYSALLEAREGEEPFAWSVESGVLPDGLLLNATTGEISGIPEKEGNFDFVIKVTDAQKHTATEGFTIRIIMPSEVNVNLKVYNGDGVPMDTCVVLGVDSSAEVRTAGDAGVGIYSYTFIGSAVNALQYITIACSNLSPVELKTVAFKPVLLGEINIYCGKASSSGGTISGNITVSSAGNQWTVFTQGGADSSTGSGTYTVGALSGNRDVVAVEYGSPDKFSIKRNIIVSVGSDTPNIDFDFTNPVNYYLFTTTISGAWTLPSQLSPPSFSGAGVHLITKNGLLTRWFVFGIMNANPSGNSYTISTPDVSAFVQGEEYVLFGMVAKTGPPNVSAENNHKVPIGGANINKDLIFLSPPTLVSPQDSASVSRTPSFSWEATEGAGVYKLLIYDSGTFKDIWSIYAQPDALENSNIPNLSIPDIYNTSGFNPSWGLQSGKTYSWMVTSTDTDIHTFLSKREQPFPDMDFRKGISSGFSFTVQ